MRAALCAALLLGVGCNWGPDPDAGQFSCNVTLDCGRGFECRPQYAGGLGQCHRVGECGEESCNGLDDDCDGAVDEDFLASEPNCGACNAVCGDGNACAVVSPPPEGAPPAGTCVEDACDDGADNDGDGQIDCADLDCSSLGPAVCPP